jgi:hypothetical protein
MTRPGPGERSWSDWRDRSRAGAISPHFRAGNRPRDMARGGDNPGGFCRCRVRPSAAASVASMAASSWPTKRSAWQSRCLQMDSASGGEDLASAVSSPGQATWRPVPGQARAPCRAWFLTWRTSAGAGLRQGATLRLRGAPAGPSARLTPSTPRTEPARCLPSAIARPWLADVAAGEWIGPGPLGLSARPDHLQMRQQPLARMALQQRRG